METVRNIAQSVLPVSVTRATMAPSADTSFAAHVTSQFTNYEQDRQAKSQQTTYTTRYQLILHKHSYIYLTIL
jgi:hypothetical protein